MTDDELYDHVSRYLHYDPDTGIFTWKVAVGGRKEIPAGSQAGSVNRVGSTLLPRVIITLKSKRYYAHKLAFLLSHKKMPTGQVDHINHDTLDNRLINLRIVDNATNCKNKSRSKNNTTGVTGVYYCRSKLKWVAKIGVDNKLNNIGQYETFDEAVEARRKAEVQYGFHPNHGK